MYETELYHHGVKGQRWGVRRYQNYDGTLTAKGKKRDLKTAGQYKRALNRIDQGLAEEGHYLRKSQEKVKRLDKKSDKAYQKYLDSVTTPDGAWKDERYYNELAGQIPLNKYSKKLDKINRKLGAAQDEVKQHQSYIDAGQKLSNQILKEAKSKGYTVQSKEVARIANIGHYYLHAYVLGAPISAARNAEYVTGNYYKVTKPKNEYKSAKPYNTTKPVRPTKSEARDLAAMETDDLEFSRDVDRIKKSRRN